jgi:hypothetical protein
MARNATRAKLKLMVADDSPRPRRVCGPLARAVTLPPCRMVREGDRSIRFRR